MSKSIKLNKAQREQYTMTASFFIKAQTDTGKYINGKRRAVSGEKSTFISHGKKVITDVESVVK